MEKQLLRAQDDAYQCSNELIGLKTANPGVNLRPCQEDHLQIHCFLVFSVLSDGLHIAAAGVVPIHTLDTVLGPNPISVWCDIPMTQCAGVLVNTWCSTPRTRYLKNLGSLHKLMEGSSVRDRISSSLKFFILSAPYDNG